MPATTPGTSFDLVNGWTWIQVLAGSRPVSETWSGSSRASTNADDYERLMAARRAADIILVTSRTAEAEHYRPSKHAPICVIDRNGRFIPPTASQLQQPMECFNSVAAYDNQHPTGKVLLESGLKFAAEHSNRIRQILLTITSTSEPTVATVLDELAELFPLATFREISRALDRNNTYLTFEASNGVATGA